MIYPSPRSFENSHLHVESSSYVQVLFVKVNDTIFVCWQFTESWNIEVDTGSRFVDIQVSQSFFACQIINMLNYITSNLYTYIIDHFKKGT